MAQKNILDYYDIGKYEGISQSIEEGKVGEIVNGTNENIENIIDSIKEMDLRKGKKTKKGKFKFKKFKLVESNIEEKSSSEVRLTDLFDCDEKDNPHVEGLSATIFTHFQIEKNKPIEKEEYIKSMILKYKHDNAANQGEENVDMVDTPRDYIIGLHKTINNMLTRGYLIEKKGKLQLNFEIEYKNY